MGTLKTITKVAAAIAATLIVSKAHAAPQPGAVEFNEAQVDCVTCALKAAMPGIGSQNSGNLKDFGSLIQKVANSAAAPATIEERTKVVPRAGVFAGEVRVELTEVLPGGKTNTYYSSGYTVGPCLVGATFHGVTSKTPGAVTTIAVSAGESANGGLKYKSEATIEAQGKYNSYTAAEDMALLRTKNCVGKKVGWYETDTPKKGEAVVLAGTFGEIAAKTGNYDELRAGVGTIADEADYVIVDDKKVKTGALWHTAPYEHGSSGAPLIALRNGVPVVVGHNVGGRAAIRSSGGAAVDGFFFMDRFEKIISADIEAYGQTNPMKSINANQQFAELASATQKQI
jgi:hypothetical protein